MSGGSQAEPLLRWAGSKRSLLDQLNSRCPRDVRRYVEPFAGSACLFFAIAPDRAVLGDLNSELMATYRTLRDQPTEVAKQAHGWDRDAETYYAVRALARAELSEVEAAARFIYLNRLCFNGVYRTNRSGQFNVPFGSRTGALPSTRRIAACAGLLQKADLRDGDFEATVDDVEAGDFVYLDPPYSRAVSDAYGVYGYGSFAGSDFDRLLSCLRGLNERGAQVLLSYTWDPRLAELDEDWRIDEVSVTSQVGGTTSSRTTRREVLVSNYP